MQAMRWSYDDLMSTPEEVVYLARQKLHHENEKQRQDMESANSSGTAGVNERRPRKPLAPPPGQAHHLDVPDDQAASRIGPMLRGDV